MEFTNDILEKMHVKQDFNKKISGYFYRMYKDIGDSKYYRLFENVKNCMDFWSWDKYSVNLVLDLKKVKRCKCKFCSNCRRLDLSRSMHNLEDSFRVAVRDGYYPCLLTLTVPNVVGGDLRFTLNKMQRVFTKFWRWFSLDSGKKFSKRYFKFVGAVRCLEVNYNWKLGNYHPHYHVLVVIDSYDKDFFTKYIKGEWSNNRGSYNYYSDFDIQIRKLWTIAWNDFSISKYDTFDILDLYKCDIREMDSWGIYEVFKYTFKDTDINSYSVFLDLYFALYRLKVRQGYGIFYGIKLENESTGKKQDIEDFLEICKEELPVELVTQGLETLYANNSCYANYTKISRFNKDKYISD